MALNFVFFTLLLTRGLPVSLQTGPCNLYFPSSLALCRLVPHQIKAGPVTVSVSKQPANCVSQQTYKVVRLSRLAPWGDFSHHLKTTAICRIVAQVVVAASADMELPFLYFLSGVQRPFQYVSFVS